MKKLLRIVGIVAAVGGVFVLAGVLLGGRLGSLSSHDGRLVYSNSRDTFYLADSPNWLKNLEGLSISSLGLNIFGVAETNYDETSSESIIEDNGHLDEPEDEANSSMAFSGSSQTITSGNIVDINGYDSFEISIDYGYVTIQSGDAPQISIDGYLAADIWEEDGVLYIQSNCDDVDISQKSIDTITHYFKDGEDITTWFTITVPEYLGTIDARLGTGALDISSLNTDNFYVTVEVGAAKINNVTAQYTNLSADLGAISATDLDTGIAELDCNLGSINIKGSVTDYLWASCSLGAIEANITEPELYGYEISTELGSVKLGDITVSGASEKEMSGDYDTMFYLDCQLGSIAIKFRN